MQFWQKYKAPPRQHPLTSRLPAGSEWMSLLQIHSYKWTIYSATKIHSTAHTNASQLAWLAISTVTKQPLPTCHAAVDVRTVLIWMQNTKNIVHARQMHNLRVGTPRWKLVEDLHKHWRPKNVHLSRWALRSPWSLTQKAQMAIQTGSHLSSIG